MSKPDLGAISRHLIELGQTLSRIKLANGIMQRQTPSDEALNVASLLSRAERLIEQRKIRELVFGEHDGSFGDPGFDILLWIYAEGLRGRRCAASDPSHATNVRLSTALRWQSFLVERGLLIRQPDDADKRRHYVRCTTAGIEIMTKYLSRLSV